MLLLSHSGPEVNDEGHEDENVGDGTANEDGANHRRNNNQDGNMKELSSQQVSKFFKLNVGLIKREKVYFLMPYMEYQAV